MELKSGEGTVVVADRDRCCNDGCCCNRNSGWGSGWGAVGGALVGGGFGAAATSRMANRKSSASSKTPLKTRKLLVLTE